MAVKIRMTRMGRRHRPFFRINAVESRTPRDGRILEKLGHYDPLEKNADKQYVLNRERIEYWLGQGAIPSDTCAEIFKRQLSITCPHYEAKLQRRARARAVARKLGKPFTKAERLAAGGAGAGEGQAAKEE
ncbi:MAG TPA: 30S ribosomal protein S16 [Anaerohalosphaeraceae bacterium]|nr:30S ribosomal protein S16 [Phycisphaerae bacterium]HOK95288.1 30S ribosomal protein S16 [Anaerohalosphaeraceae bacterium]HOM76702.1 30S ribosomal protein S16 [Anaerohalosphaeraceae bacterium]HPC65316.1 30S ribosomal protein S16 [Anaerohalosphaeraceae bacterium]HPO70064.1 30S ribosomal protein S16 [Anaerohalosphaeraceae bacterium]